MDLGALSITRNTGTTTSPEVGTVINLSVMYKSITFTGIKIIGFMMLPFIFFMGIHLLIATCAGIFNSVAGNSFTASFIGNYMADGNIGVSIVLTILLCAGLLAHFFAVNES